MSKRPSYGDRFAARRMAENYAFRPPYSAEVYETLIGLFEDRPKVLLDAGCGPGKIVLGLVDQVDRVDAIDPLSEMLKVARAAPKGESPKIRWICARSEDAPLLPPYGLIVAGANIHWMILDRVLLRFGEALAPHGFLVVLDGDAAIDAPWEKEADAFMIDFVERLEGKRPNWWSKARQQLDGPILAHPKFNPVGAKITLPIMVSQSIADYLRCQHSRATWSEDHLGKEAAAQFDAGMSAILEPHASDGLLRFAVQTRIEWGRIVQ